jgi:hypothetical protein
LSTSKPIFVMKKLLSCCMQKQRIPVLPLGALFSRSLLCVSFDTLHLNIPQTKCIAN